MPKVQDTHAAVHRNSVEASASDVAAYLQDVLGQTLVAYILKTDRKTVARWASGGSPRVANERRLRDAYHVFRLLLTQESPHTVRAWFVGLNPQLDDRSPAEALREGQDRDVLVAAKSFLAGG